jgi:hypothetical protein
VVVIVCRALVLLGLPLRILVAMLELVAAAPVW